MTAESGWGSDPWTLSAWRLAVFGVGRDPAGPKRAVESPRMLAAVGDTPYNVIRLIHLVSVIIGTGLVFSAPVIAARARRETGRATQQVVDDAAATLVFPTLLVAGIAGGALVGLSDDFWDFSQTWLSVGGAVWFATLVLSAAVYPPSYLQIITVSDDRKRMLAGMLHLALAVMLVLMVWKFGARDGAY